MNLNENPKFPTKGVIMYKNRSMKQDNDRIVDTDHTGPYKVIGAGQIHVRKTISEATKVAMKIRNEGWWVSIVDLPTLRLVAEYGSVTDTPRQ